MLLGVSRQSRLCHQHRTPPPLLRARRTVAMALAFRKRKKKKVYAVRVGKTTGVFASWEECRDSVRVRCTHTLHTHAHTHAHTLPHASCV